MHRMNCLESISFYQVLIREVTRRVNLSNVWQAVYTGGMFLPRPVSDCRYFHRSLNISKLVDIHFSSLPERQTIEMAQRIYALPKEHVLSGIRCMEEKDISSVQKLLMSYFNEKNVLLHPVFDDEDVRHWLLPRDKIIHSFVRELSGELPDS